jgi:hypothetical protein
MIVPRKIISFVKQWTTQEQQQPHNTTEDRFIARNDNIVWPSNVSPTKNYNRKTPKQDTRRYFFSEQIVLV